MSSPHDPPPPNEKKLRIGSFSLSAARGLVRDQQTRRMTIFVIVLVAPVLDPKLRPGWLIFYWAVCAGGPR